MFPRLPRHHLNQLSKMAARSKLEIQRTSRSFLMLQKLKLQLYLETCINSFPLKSTLFQIDLQRKKAYFGHTKTDLTLFSSIQTLTVGIGISPIQPACAGSRTLPPVGNHTLP